MAIANNSWVIPQTIAAAVLLDGAPLLAQPPHTGIASGAVGGPPAVTVDVLWDNGVFDQDIPVGSLVEVLAADASAISDFSGQVVRRTVNNQSQEYIGVALFIAKWVLASPVNVAVVKSLGPNRFYWVSVTSDLEVVEGR